MIFRDYLYLNFTAEKYARINVRILFGTSDFEKPFEGLKSTIEHIQDVPKITRYQQHRVRLKEKLEKYSSSVKVRRSLDDFNKVI